MKKRLLALALCLALLFSTVSVTGVLSAFAAEKTTVLCIGDSITFGYASRSDGSGYQLANTWPKVLGNLLGSGYDVTNLGISGTTVVDGNGRSSWLSYSQGHSEYAIPAADIALIMLGTNDSISDWSGSRKDAFKTEYKALIDAIKAKNSDVDIWVMTSPYTDRVDALANLPEVVAMQKEFAQENGLHIIDIYTASKAYYDANGAEGYFGGYDIQLNVRLHPGEPALADIAKTVYEAMNLPTMTGSFAPTYLTGEADAALLAGDNLAKPLLAEKIYENNYPVFKNVYSWYDVTFNGYNSQLNPRYIRTTYDAQYNYLMTDGLLQGVNTTANWSNSYISVGATNHNRTADHKPYEYATARIVFDLGAATQLDRVVFGDCVADALKRKLWKGTLSIANSMEDLFSDDTIVGTWSYLEDQYSFPSSVDKYGVAFKLNGLVTGRYVAVEVPADNTSGYKTYFGEIGIFASEKEEQMVAPHYITGVNDAKYILNDAHTQANMVLQNGKNLMTGRWGTANNANGTAVLKNVYSYYSWNYSGAGAGWSNSRAQGEVTSAEVLSDGLMYNVSFSNSWSTGYIEIGGTNHAVNGSTPVSNYEMVKVIFDLGESKDLGRILFGDRNDNTTLAARLWKGQLYVGDQFGDGLFQAENKYGEWSYIDDSKTTIGTTETTDKMGVVFDFDKAVTGRYVGIVVPAAGNGGGYQIRLSEVGIYAAEDTVHFLEDGSDAAYLENNGKNLVEDILAADAGHASDAQWVADGLTTEGATTEAHIREYATKLSYLTDGKIKGINGTADEHAVVQVGVNTDGATTSDWHGYKHQVGKLTFDLGKSKKLGRVLVGFPETDLATYNPFMGVIYVSDSKDTLYSADSIVGYWNYLNGDNNRYGLLPTTLSDKGVVLDFAKGVTGRYVGIAMPENAGIGYGIRLSELGIYEYVEKQTGDDSTADEGYQAAPQATVENLTAATLPTPNHLANATVIVGSGQNFDKATDGVVNGINGNEDNKALFKATGGTVVNPITGATITNASGWTQVGYQLGSRTSIEKLVVAGSNSDAVNATSYTNKYVLYYEIYISNNEGSLFSAANRVLCYDNSSAAPASASLAQLITLPKAVSGTYVGFKMTAGQYGQSYIGEFGIYGEADPIVPPLGTVTQLSSTNANLIPEKNLLGVLPQLVVGTAKQNEHLAYDGLVNGVNYSGDNKGLYAQDTIIPDAPGDDVVVDSESGKTNALHPVTGEVINNAAGWTTVGYKLYNEATIEKLLVAGSNSDAINPTGYTNKYVLYYEIYVSDSEDTLFDEDSMVFSYDNSTGDPNGGRLAQLITLITPATGSYVGFRVTAGQYSQSYIGEFGVYGTMDAPEVLKSTALGSQEEYDAAITDGMVNLLKGEAVPGKTVSYLEPQGVSLDDSEKPYLTDDYINWTADMELKQANYTVGQSQGIWYDLRAAADLDGILVANNRNDALRHRITNVVVYAGDDHSKLFEESHIVGVVNLPASNIASYISLAGLDVNARYIGLDIAGDAEYDVVRLIELGVYGTYTGTPKAVPQSLLTGDRASRTDAYTISAHGIDNSTAGAGNKNTGTLSGIRNFSQMENLNGLHDGNTEEHVYAHILQEGKSIHVYELEADSPWVVFAYYLGGSANLETINLISANELTKYYTTGVQYYASNTYADLFKDESLLYTTGGEKCITDPETGDLMLDPSTEVWRQRSISYTLTPEQQAKTYKFVACVITRPYSLYEADLDGDGDFSDLRLNAYGVARLSEFDVKGSLTGGDKPLITTYTAQSKTLGTVTATIQPTKFDYDSPDFFYAIDHMQVTEEKLSADVTRNVDNNWMSVDGDTVYRVHFYGADGKQLTDPENHDIQFIFKTGADYVQYVGRLEDGAIRRIMNASTQTDGYVHVGMNNYPVYGSEQVNNRDLATLHGLEHPLVLLKYNDLDTIHQLSGTVKRPSISEFEADMVAGATAQTENTVLPAVCVTAATVLIGLLPVWLWQRKRRVSTEKGGEQA